MSRTKSYRVVWLALCALAACHESPLHPVDTSEPEADPDALVAASAASSFACTKNWASGIGGNWLDATRWTPAGVPGPSDVACIDAPGTYDVLLPIPVQLSGLTIGHTNNAFVTFDFAAPAGSELSVGNGHLNIRSGSTLNILSTGQVVLYGDHMDLDGTLDIENTCACGGEVALVDFRQIYQGGRMELDAPMTISLTTWVVWENAIVMSGSGVVDVVTRAPFTDSELHLSGTVTVAGSTQMHVDNVSWSGGTIGMIDAVTSAIEVQGGTISMAVLGGSQSGRLDAITDADGLNLHIAEIPSSVDLHVTALNNQDVRFYTSGEDTLTNHGGIFLSANGTNRVELNTGEFANRGNIDVTGSGSIDFASLSGGTFTNEGSLWTWGSDLGFVTPGSTFRNVGQVSSFNSMTLTMASGSEFVAETSSHIGPPLVLEGATLRGDGRVGTVTSKGGVIIPGAPYGTLDARDVTFDAKSQLIIQVGDTTPGEYGQLDVGTRDITYDGLLVIANHLGAPLGRCGNVITPIRHDGGTKTGAFSAVLGAVLGQYNWRLQGTADSLMLAGHESTTAPLSTSRASVPVSEGGAPEQIQLCLGAKAPRADVTVTPTFVGGQVAPTRNVTFPQATWGLPQALPIDAVDDTVVEDAIHHDALRFTLASDNPAYKGAVKKPVSIAITDNDGDADLQLVAYHSSVTTSVGGSFEVEFRLTNLGPTLSTGSTLTLDAQGATNFSFASDYNATCTDQGAGVLACDVAGLAAGAFIDVAATYDATATGSTTINATISGRQLDGNAANDVAPVDIVVN